jgi:hypothetical protein
MPHHVGRCCTYVIPGHSFVFGHSYANLIPGDCCTVETLGSNCATVGSNNGPPTPLLLKNATDRHGRAHKRFIAHVRAWRIPQKCNAHAHTGLFKNRKHLKKLFYKTTDAKSMPFVRMERKSLRVLIWMIWIGSSLRLWLLLPVKCCVQCGKSWIMDLTSVASHVGLTSSACKVWK